MDKGLGWPMGPGCQWEVGSWTRTGLASSCGVVGSRPRLYPRARDRVNAAARPRRSRKILGRVKLLCGKIFAAAADPCVTAAALVSFGGVFILVTVNSYLVARIRGALRRGSVSFVAALAHSYCGGATLL